MFRWIIKSSLRYRFIVLAVAAALMFTGAEQIRHTPLDVFPEFAPPIVEIQTPCLGLCPTEVEALVTIPSSRRSPACPAWTSSARSRSPTCRR
jgi:Cu/Ag efflux pump CusA